MGKTVVSPANTLIVWLSVFLGLVRDGMPIPADLTYHGIERVTVYMKSGIPYILVRYVDGTLVQLASEVIHEIPPTAQLDPPLQCV